MDNVVLFRLSGENYCYSNHNYRFYPIENLAVRGLANQISRCLDYTHAQDVKW